MANRTFKVMGFAYAPSGSVSATVSVNGSQVFNGAVTTTNTPRDGGPTDSEQLLSFELDESVTTLSYSVSVSGGELCWGRTKTNGVQALKITSSWLDSNIPDDTNASAEAQNHIADTLGVDALGADLYNALKAGTVTNPTAEQRTAIDTASKYIDWANDYWHLPEHLTNPQLNGSAWPNWGADTMGEGNIFVLADGDTFTFTWTHDATDNCTLVE